MLRQRARIVACEWVATRNEWRDMRGYGVQTLEMALEPLVRIPVIGR